MTATSQPAVLAATPATARFLTFRLVPGADPRPALVRLGHAPHDPAAVVGFGAPLVRALGAAVPGLREFPAIDAPGARFPAWQGALFARVGAGDPGASFDDARRLAALLGDAFALDDEAEGFVYRGGRDLSGYEDGTANPVGDAARDAALVPGDVAGLSGGSFVAVQRWVHDLDGLAELARPERDALVGRTEDTNVELPEAPASAHLKRTEQEDFDPPAFMVRRSMPWGGLRGHGLMFVAFVAELDRFERPLRRMAGLDDGVADGLLRFSRAVSGGYYFCPPVRDGSLDLRALGL